MKSEQTVIVSGGMLEESFVLDILQSENTGFIIGVDGGLSFLHRHEIRPDYIVGDFDSAPAEVIAYYKAKKEIPMREFDPVKDASDTEIAVRLAIGLGKKSVTLLGGTGSRLDHVWANVQVLKLAHDAGVEMRILDSHNKIRLIEKGIKLRREDAYGPYFSVFPLDGTVENFFIQGAKYPLYDHTLTPYDSRCVSNQIAGDEAEISFPGGFVILMETRD